MIEVIDVLPAGPSAHLSWDEVACSDGTPYPFEWRMERAHPLGIEFELIRARVGCPIGVSSAYRTLAYNRSIGSKSTGQHPQGRALDLTRPRHLSRGEFLGHVLVVARRKGALIRGVGDYPTFVHIDTRTTTRLARWTGSRKSN